MLYDESQGMLHCLSASAGEIAQLFKRQSSWSTEALATTLLGDTPTESDLELVENVLAHFQSQGFVDRLPA